MRRRLVLTALLLALTDALTVRAGGNNGPAVGSRAPDFKSRDAVTHEPIHLSEQTGKVVVLTFWATWCTPCRQELPILENLQAQVGKDRLIVYAVPFQQPEQSYDALVRLLRSWKLTLVDDPRGTIAGRYGINSIPHLFLIGRDGRIAAEHLGYGQGFVEQLVADVNAAFQAAPAAAPDSDVAPSAAH